MPEPAPSPEAPPGDEIGVAVSFFAHPSVVIIAIQKGTLKVGETIWIKGHTTDLKETIRSMQIDHKPVTEAKQGDEVGIQVSAKVRQHDRVYKIAS